MNSKNKIILSVVAVLAIAAIIALGIRNQMQKQPEDENVIRIGAILPLTGAFAFEGEKAAAAIRMAADEFNDSPSAKKKIQLLLEDGKFTVKDSISAYRLISNKGLSGLITFGTPTTMAIKDILNTGTIMMVIDGTSGIPQSNEQVFRCLQPTSHVAIAMIKLLEKENKQNVSLLYMDGDSGKDFHNAFVENFHGTINAFETFNFDSQDVRASIAKLLRHNNDAICVFGYGMGYANALNQLAETNYEGTIITDLNVTSIVDQLKNKGDGIEYVSLVFGNDSKNELSKKFIQKQEKEYSSTPTAFSAFSYEAAKMLATAFNEAKDEQGAIDWLKNMKDYDSVVGKISYNQDGELCLPFSVYTINKEGASVYTCDLPTIGFGL